jgi:hypothetical protein
MWCEIMCYPWVLHVLVLFIRRLIGHVIIMMCPFLWYMVGRSKSKASRVPRQTFNS